MSTTALLATPTAASATTDACAKINLTLDVVGRRNDGFHELRSLVIGIGLSDRVRCTSRPGSGISINCPNADIGEGENLAYRAAVLLAERSGIELSTRIELEKTIPIGAGLGGGSSDAAATLRACNHLWETGLAPSKLSELGAELGSDVPLFFSLPSAVITGRGEHVQPVRLRWQGWVLLVFTGPVVPTAEVYRRWRRSDTPSLSTDAEVAILEAGTAAEISKAISNQLESAVFRVSPVVGRVRDELHRLGCGPMQVSGAGSTLYRLFDTEEEALSPADNIRQASLPVATAVVRAPVGESPVVSKEE